MDTQRLTILKLKRGMKGPGTFRRRWECPGCMVLIVIKGMTSMRDKVSTLGKASLPKKVDSRARARKGRYMGRMKDIKLEFNAISLEIIYLFINNLSLKSSNTMLNKLTRSSRCLVPHSLLSSASATRVSSIPCLPS